MDKVKWGFGDGIIISSSSSSSDSPSNIQNYHYSSDLKQCFPKLYCLLTPCGFTK